jgi:hypothetical protein
MHWNLNAINTKHRNLCSEVGVKVNYKVCSQQGWQEVGSVCVPEPNPTISDGPALLPEFQLCCDSRYQPQEIRDDNLAESSTL